MADETQPPPPPSNPEQPASLAQRFGLTESLKKAFSEYIEQNRIRPAQGNDLNVDLDFLKHHAGPLLVSMLKGATQTLLPKDLKFSVPAPPPAASEGDQPKAPVNVNFDLGDFLSKLFNPPDTNPPR